MTKKIKKWSMYGLGLLLIISGVAVWQLTGDKETFAAGGNFGYESWGETWVEWTSADEFFGGYYTSPSGITDATVTSISFYGGEDRTGAVYIKAIIADNSGNILTNGISDALLVKEWGSKGWNTATFSTPPSISANTEYIIGVIPDSGTNNLGFCYDGFQAGENGEQDTGNSYASPNNVADTTKSDYKMSIYATYSEGGGGGEASTRNRIIIIE